MSYQYGGTGDRDANPYPVIIVSTFITQGQGATTRPSAYDLKQICVPMRCAFRIAPLVKLHTTGSTMWNEV